MLELKHRQSSSFCPARSIGVGRRSGAATQQNRFRSNRSIKIKAKTIDEYLALAKPDQRAVLKKLRQAIHSAAPGAEEYIGYGLAGFKFNQRPLIYFGAWENHCAIYAASPAVQKKFQKELKGFEVSKGTIRFTPDKPLPVTLVKALVKARIAENTRAA